MWGRKTRSNALGAIGIVLLLGGIAGRFDWISVDVSPIFYIVLGAVMLVHGALILKERRRDTSGT